MKVAFVLSMPGHPTWNGKWSGEGNLYAVISSFPRKKDEQERLVRILQKGHFTYRFGDGWVASISVSLVDDKTARQMRNRSKSFCGYNWMITSLLEHGMISAPLKTI